MASDNKWVSASTAYITPRSKETGDAWAEEAAAAGAQGTQRLSGVGETPAPVWVAHALSVKEGSPVVVRRRVIELDGVPVELADTYYPVEIARGTALAKPQKIKGGAVSLLAALGHEAARVREDVSARMPTHAELAQLEAAGDEPVIVLRRLTLDADGRPVQADVMVAPSAVRHLQYELKVD